MPWFHYNRKLEIITCANTMPLLFWQGSNMEVNCVASHSGLEQIQEKKKVTKDLPMVLKPF